MADCDFTLTGIPKDCKGSIGGLSQLWLANRDYASPVEDTGEKAPILSAITLDTTTEAQPFKRYWFKKENASFTTTMTENGAYVTTLTAIFEKMSAEKSYEWEMLAADGTCALVRDNNGKWWYLGFTNPLTLDRGGSQGETGSARDDNNQYTFVLIDYDIRPPHEVPADIATGAINPTAPAVAPLTAPVVQTLNAEEKKSSAKK